MNLPLIYGFNGTTDIGVTTFGASIFLPSCNLRCPYCMNSKLLFMQDSKSKPIDISEVKAFVQDRKREWVMISGGEPTCTSLEQLRDLILEIKSWGCKVGMSTNGTNPYIIEKLVGELNYVALDIKTSRSQLVYFWGGLENVYLTLRILKRHKNDNFNYEVRTTLYPPFVNEEDIGAIAKNLNNSDKWVLQQFRLAKNRLVINDVQPYNEEQVNNLLKVAQIYVPETSVSYV